MVLKFQKLMQNMKPSGISRAFKLKRNKFGKTLKDTYYEIERRKALGINTDRKRIKRIIVEKWKTRTKRQKELKAQRNVQH